jgi:hypothetical protein
MKIDRRSFALTGIVGAVLSLFGVRRAAAEPPAEPVRLPTPDDDPTWPAPIMVTWNVGGRGGSWSFDSEWVKARTRGIVYAEGVIGALGEPDAANGEFVAIRLRGMYFRVGLRDGHRHYEQYGDRPWPEDVIKTWTLRAEARLDGDGAVVSVQVLEGAP